MLKLSSPSIKHLESFSKTPIRFTLDGDVVSQACIDARRAALLSAQHPSLKTLSVMTSAIWAVLSLLVFVTFTALWDVFDAGIPLSLGYATIGGAALIGWTAHLYLLRRIAVVSPLSVEMESLMPLPPSYCYELLSACEIEPEAEAYRQRVLAEGRAFVMGEFNLLVEHASGTNDRAACKELYEVPA